MHAWALHVASTHRHGKEEVQPMLSKCKLKKKHFPGAYVDGLGDHCYMLVEEILRILEILYTF